MPRYAILSHTWGNEEVTYEDMVEASGRNKASYKKIKFCGEQAAMDGLRYFWVDSCCIKKPSDSELWNHSTLCSAGTNGLISVMCTYLMSPLRRGKAEKRLCRRHGKRIFGRVNGSLEARYFKSCLLHVLWNSSVERSHLGDKYSLEEIIIRSQEYPL